MLICNVMIQSQLILLIFYFNARYPGDDYIDVSDEDLQKCVDIMEDIKYKVESYLKYKKDEKLDNSSIIDKAIKSMFTGQKVWYYKSI